MISYISIFRMDLSNRLRLYETTYWDCTNLAFWPSTCSWNENIYFSTMTMSLIISHGKNSRIYSFDEVSLQNPNHLVILRITFCFFIYFQQHEKTQNLNEISHFQNKNAHFKGSHCFISKEANCTFLIHFFQLLILFLILY